MAGIIVGGAIVIVVVCSALCALFNMQLQKHSMTLDEARGMSLIAALVLIFLSVAVSIYVIPGASVFSGYDPEQLKEVMVIATLTNVAAVLVSLAVNMMKLKSDRDI